MTIFKFSDFYPGLVYIGA